LPFNPAIRIRQRRGLHAYDNLLPLPREPGRAASVEPQIPLSWVCWNRGKRQLQTRPETGRARASKCPRLTVLEKICSHRSQPFADSAVSSWSSVRRQFRRDHFERTYYFRNGQARRGRTARSLAVEKSRNQGGACASAKARAAKLANADRNEECPSRFNIGRL